LAGVAIERKEFGRRRVVYPPAQVSVNPEAGSLSQLWKRIDHSVPLGKPPVMYLRKI
jgi:hypothetical protein